MKILVLGSRGQVGRCLKDQFKKTNLEVFFTSRKKIDVTNFDQTKKIILSIAPDVIINSTAYTDVDKAENNKDHADNVNHLAVRNLAVICNEIDCWLIHISTDYVFDGISQLPYCEDDITNPQTIYGKSKLMGELAIQSLHFKHIIIRTAWIYSEYGNNFLKTMLKLEARSTKVGVVDDQIGCPTYAQDIAKCIVEIIIQLGSNNESMGIYHFCGDTKLSWFNFAEEIFIQYKKIKKSCNIRVIPLSSEEYPTIASRPMFSVLDNNLIQHKFGVTSSNLENGILRSLRGLESN